jgi:hypothetical protein
LNVFICMYVVFVCMYNLSIKELQNFRQTGFRKQLLF